MGRRTVLRERKGVGEDGSGDPTLLELLSDPRNCVLPLQIVGSTCIKSKTLIFFIFKNSGETKKMQKEINAIDEGMQKKCKKGGESKNAKKLHYFAPPCRRVVRSPPPSLPHLLLELFLVPITPG